MSILVMGGAGFIGANFVMDWLAERDEAVICLDALTYAGNPDNLAGLNGDERYRFVHGAIGDAGLVGTLLAENDIRAIVNFAAETHVDRSIAGAAPFFQTNVMETLTLLETTRSHLATLADARRKDFRFIHVSTDEVYGSLAPDEPAFTETSRFQPNSPYAASKASSDHIVRAYHETHELPAIITNCSNNYGPRQFPEKLIPLVITRALGGKALPVYGDGRQIRDWLYVGDHCAAIRRVLDVGVPGEIYNIGGDNQVANIDVVTSICALLDRKRPRRDGGSYSQQITHVTDRPGHDRRYAINAEKIKNTLGWTPIVGFEEGLGRTVEWYLDNPGWVEKVTSGAYRDWIARHYA